MWQGLSSVSSYKPRAQATAASDPPVIKVTLSNDPKHLYSRFDVANTEYPAFTPLHLSDQHGMLVTENEVCKTLFKTKVRKATGTDGISPCVAKSCSGQLSPVLKGLLHLSPERRTIPLGNKESTIFPVPKKSPVTCLNDFRPIALTSVLMSCLEQLVLDYIKREIPASVDPLQYVQVKSRSVEDAITVALNFKEHLDKGNAYARMLFIDYSSAFNTIIPSNLVQKLKSVSQSV